MNEVDSNNEYFATVKEFRQRINHFLDESPLKIDVSLINRINDNFQMLNPEY